MSLYDQVCTSRTEDDLKTHSLEACGSIEFVHYGFTRVVKSVNRELEWLCQTS
jgi:hypothetical protein